MTGFYTEYDDTSGVHVSSAEDAAAAALASKNAAAASATDAASSESNAASSKTSAATSATNAATSETNAATSATNAATSATTASTKAGEAASSASTAATSATAAATSATNAATSATNAASSATAAATAETNAETAETNAETAETNAASSATASASSASTASTQATNASNSASAAATSATNAGNSETAAATSATNAASSQTAAASSASTASSSATTATTKAGEAATSATNSATSATNSSNSATSAGTAQTAAEAARDAALAAFDSFDDRYLGQKSSDPTVDNDGNALVAGTLYFNTTTDEMKVYEGSSWVAAYASLSGALIATNNLSDLNNAGTARTNLGLGTAATTAATAYATAAQGTKVDGIEASADVTDTANVTASGALMDSELTSIASVKALNQGVATGDSPTFTGIDVTGTATMDDAVISGSNPTLTIYETDTTNLNTRFDNGGGDLYIQTVNDDGSSPKTRMLIDHATGDINLGYEDTGTTAKLFWDASAESLGIGTSSPVSPLQIQNADPQVIMTQTAGGVNRFLAFDVGLAADVDTQFITVDQADNLAFGEKLTASDRVIENEWMRITNAGNVGIGTSSPSSALDVAGTLTGTTALLGGSQIMASTAALQVNGFQRTGTIYLHEGNTAVAGNNWTITTTSGGELQWDGNKVWTAGNDGSGSGLDADLLDGQHGSYYYAASNPNGYTNDQTAAEILTAIKTVDGSGSGLDADTVDGVQAIQLYRGTGSAAATAGAGWVTVASNTDGRKHGEVIVSDSDSGDHSFIRIDWLRSYADSSFTVINSGGHQNRITSVRVLEQSSDVTYGTKYLQVYVTTSSSYSVRINTVADVGGNYSSHTVVTPVTQNAITGYQAHSDVNLLDSNNLASSQGIASGSGVFHSTADDAELKYYYNGSSLSGLKCSVSGAQTTAASGRIRFGSSTASFIQNGPGVSSNLTMAANGGSSFFYGATNAATHHATIASQSAFNCGYGSVQYAYMVRAWGRFEMTGTHSWRDDEGFSSISDIATGRSRLYFTSTMPNAYYSVQVTAGSTSYATSIAAANVYTLSTTSFYVSVEDVDSGLIDKDQMNVTVVR